MPHTTGQQELPPDTSAPFEEFETETTITGTEMFADMILNGYAEPGDDVESQQLAAQVREVNTGWKPGRIPRVPRGYRNGVAVRASQTVTVALRSATASSTSARRFIGARRGPTRQARSTRRVRSTNAKSPPGSSSDDPPSPSWPLAGIREVVRGVRGVR